MDTLDKIFYLLKNKGISQKSFADAIGVKNYTITEWKNGKSQSYMKYIDKIADFLEVSSDYLLGRDAPDIKDHTSTAMPLVIAQYGEIFKYIATLSSDEQLEAKKHFIEYLQLPQEQRKELISFTKFLQAKEKKND